MYGRAISGLEDDLKNLQNDALDVLLAIEKLDRQIYDEINDYRLVNGSHLKTSLLDTLSEAQRWRVLENFVGRFYERKRTHHQYKIVLDLDNSHLAILSAELSTKHLCVEHHH